MSSERRGFRFWLGRNDVVHNHPSQNRNNLRKIKERIAGRGFFLATWFPLAVLLAIVIALLVRTWPLLGVVSPWEILSGQTWKPLQGLFGMFPFIAGTLWVTLVAMVLAVPPCLLSAIYLAEYARPRVREAAKPLLDLLAAIPSVVYGVWGLVAIVPLVQWLSPRVSGAFGFLPFLRSSNPTGFSILAGGIVLAVMVAPFIIAVTYEVLRSVPAGGREASLAIGATRWQTIKYAVLPQSRAGISAGIVFGVSRALGETMAVLMVVGNVSKVPSSIFDPAYPLPALIANNYGEMMSIPLYDSALLGAALVLLLVVLFFNIISALALRRITGRTQV